MTGWGRDFIHDASSPRSCPSDFLSTSPVSGAKAQAFIERAWTSGPTKEAALFIGSPFHGCVVAAGGLDTDIVGLIRGYACRRGSDFLCPAHIVFWARSAFKVRKEFYAGVVSCWGVSEQVLFRKCEAKLQLI